MNLTAVQAAGGLVGSNVLTVLITQAFGWLRSRGRNRADVQGAVDDAFKTALTGTTSELKRLTARLDKQNKVIDAMGAEIERLKIDQARERADCERRLAELRRQVDELMEQVATQPLGDYTEIKRVAK